MSKKKEAEARQQEFQEDIRRVKLPRGDQVFGILEQKLGASRMRVRCLDGNTRICRIPGSMKRKLWVSEGDLLLVEPWQFGGKEKGNIIFKYKKTQVEWLKRKGVLKDLAVTEEF